MRSWRLLKLLIFLGFFLGIHYYIAISLRVFIGLAIPWWAVFLIALFYPVFASLERQMPSWLTRLGYVLAATWLGMIFLLFSALAVYGIYARIFQAQPEHAIPLLIGGVMIVSVYALLNAQRIKVSTVRVPIKGLRKSLRLVHLSDLHLGTIRGEAFARNVSRITNALHPDVVVMTGDLFDGLRPVPQETLEPLSDILAPTYFTIGNHEIYDGLPKVKRILDKTRFTVLRNQVVMHGGVQIVGVDNPPSTREKRNRILESLDIDPKKPTVLLYHPPSGLDDAAQAGVDLQLSGHTHGGQLFPFHVLTKMQYKKIRGLHQHGDMHLYISQGTGTWGPPMRLGSKSEIALIHLEPKKA